MAVAATRASKLAGLGARLGLPTSAAELSASLSPADYVYGAPSDVQLQRLLRQQMGGTQGQSGSPSEQPAAAANAAAGFGTQTALQGAAASLAGPSAAAAKPCPLSGVMNDLFSNHLALDLDDDCLKLLLGEDEDESRPCASTGGSTAKAAAGGSGGSSEKSSATDDHASDAEAASLPFCCKEEDDDIAMLFGEFRGTSNLEALDLHLLGTGHLAGDESDTASQACGSGDEGEVLAAAADVGAGLKRAKQSTSGASGGGLSPTSRGLMLSMNYEKAAESINFELLSGRKVMPCHDSFDAMLPLLSPIMDFAHIDTPESPDSLASGCDTEVALPAILLRLDSSTKRKRAVRQ